MPTSSAETMDMIRRHLRGQDSTRNRSDFDKSGEAGPVDSETTELCPYCGRGSIRSSVLDVQWIALVLSREDSSHTLTENKL